MLPLSANNTLEANEQLWRSIQTKNMQGFDSALQAGANPQEKDIIGQTALHQVVTFWGEATAIEKLLSKGADINATNADGATVLLQALKHAHYSSDRAQLESVVKLLLSKGARADSADKNQRTPLSIALELGHLPIIEALLKKGARLPADAMLKTLALGINLPLIDLLRKHATDLDLNLRNSSGQTVLHQAAKTEKLLFLLRWLAERGVDLQARDNSGSSAFAAAALGGNIPGMAYLYERGLKMDAKDHDQQQAIHLSAYAGDYAALKWLIDRGADLQAKDRWGRRPLDIVIESHTFTFASEEQRKLLVALVGGNESDIVRGRFLRPPLHVAVWSENLDEVKRLLQNGANVNVKDESGRTPLARAMELSTGKLATPQQVTFGRKLLPLLLQYGADTSLRLPITMKTYEEYADQLGIRKELDRLKERYSPQQGKSINLND